jgi:hypothetical protein
MGSARKRLICSKRAVSVFAKNGTVALAVVSREQA